MPAAALASLSCTCILRARTPRARIPASICRASGRRPSPADAPATLQATYYGLLRRSFGVVPALPYCCAVVSKCWSLLTGATGRSRGGAASAPGGLVPRSGLCPPCTSTVSLRANLYASTIPTGCAGLDWCSAALGASGAGGGCLDTMVPSRLLYTTVSLRESRRLATGAVAASASPRTLGRAGGCLLPAWRAGVSASLGPAPARGGGRAPALLATITEISFGCEADEAGAAPPDADAGGTAGRGGAAGLKRAACIAVVLPFGALGGASRPPSAPAVPLDTALDWLTAAGRAGLAAKPGGRAVARGLCASELPRWAWCGATPPGRLASAAGLLGEFVARCDSPVDGWLTLDWLASSDGRWSCDAR